MLVAGVAVVVLALAGLTYLLLDRSGGGDGTEGSGGGPGAGSGAPPLSGSGEEPGVTESSTGRGTGTGTSTTSGAPQSVKVTVAGAHTHYTGPCPPPHGQAPAVTAAFTVGRLPARVGYRWVTEDGVVSEPGRGRCRSRRAGSARGGRRSR